VLAYHNHEFEFEFVAIDGTRPIDLLLGGIARSVVELDLYWLVKAGAEPGELFERYRGGFPLVHAKDMRRSPERS
jgi:sugar phosphate isomerase/epimerase